MIFIFIFIASEARFPSNLGIFNAMQSLSALSSKVEQCMQTLTDSLDQLNANEAESSDAIEKIQHVISQATDGLKEGFEGWATNIQKNCSTLCADIQQVVSDNLTTVCICSSCVMRRNQADPVCRRSKR
jgi:ABC-type transporter Mla subunit MlaD